MKNKAAYPEARIWRELREACLERANKQCEFVHPNGKRCARFDGEIRKSKSTGRKYFVYLHAAHSANACPDDTNPELMCLCPAHHLKLDRKLEAQDRVSQRRRGYRITTTDSLLVEIREAGIEVEERSDGYRWSIEHLGLGGHATTAARAAGCALYQLRLSLERKKHLFISQQQQKRSQTMTTSVIHTQPTSEATGEPFHITLSLGDLNELFESHLQEHLVYLDGQLADWYGQLVPVVLLPDGYPALQVFLACSQCNKPARVAYAVAGEHGAWSELWEADCRFLADFCDADARQMLVCPECERAQERLVASLLTGEREVQ